MDIEGKPVWVASPKYVIVGKLDRQMPRPGKRGIGGARGHNMDEVAFPGNPGLWPGSFAIFVKAGQKNI